MNLSTGASLLAMAKSKCYQKPYFTLLPLIVAGILSIKSWSSFGSASFSSTVRPLGPKCLSPSLSSLIVTVSLVTFIVVSGRMENWNDKERKWKTLSYVDYSGSSFCKITTIHSPFHWDLTCCRINSYALSYSTMSSICSTQNRLSRPLIFIFSFFF